MMNFVCMYVMLPFICKRDYFTLNEISISTIAKMFIYSHHSSSYVVISISCSNPVKEERIIVRIILFRETWQSIRYICCSGLNVHHLYPENPH